MSLENEDLSESLAAELTGSTGMSDAGQDMPDNVAADLADQETWQAEKDIPVNNDVDDTREAAEQREAEQAQKPGRGQKVPLAALHEERTKRQALEQEAQQLRQQLQQFMAQQQAAQQAQLQAQQEAAIPDFDEDPRGYIEAKEKQFAQQLDQLKGGQQPQVQQVEAQVMQEAAVLGPVVSDAEARFEAANPDYRQAVDHAMAVAEHNMRVQHPGINEHQLGMLKTASLVQVAKHCQAQGLNPAEYMYNQAQKLGFQPASRAPRKQPNTSLSTLSGVPHAPDERSSVRVSDISEMSEAEFDKYWSDLKRSSTVRPAY